MAHHTSPVHMRTIHQEHGDNMPLDTRIPLMAQGVQLPDQMDALSKFSNIQQAQAQNRLVGLKEQEAQQGIQDRQTLARLAPQLANRETRAKVIGELPPEMQKHIVDTYGKMDEQQQKAFTESNNLIASLGLPIVNAPPQQKPAMYAESVRYLKSIGKMPADYPEEYTPETEAKLNNAVHIAVGVEGALKQQNDDRTYNEAVRGHNLAYDASIRSQDMSAETARRAQDITEKRYGEMSLAERKQAQKEEQAAKTEQLKQEQTLAKANVVLDKVDEALGVFNPETKKREGGGMLGFNTTGLAGSALSMVPGTDAYNLDKVLDTIRANIGFGELNAMRAASPTGGALGQVAVRELELLQSTLGSLEQGQDKKKLEQNLEAVSTHYNNWKSAVAEAKSNPNHEVTNPSPTVIKFDANGEPAK